MKTILLLMAINSALNSYDRIDAGIYMPAFELSVVKPTADNHHYFELSLEGNMMDYYLDIEGVHEAGPPIPPPQPRVKPVPAVFDLPQPADLPQEIDLFEIPVGNNRFISLPKLYVLCLLGLVFYGLIRTRPWKKKEEPTTTEDASK